METSSIIQVVSILLAVVGAWLVAFGLKIRLPGDMSDREREEKRLTTTAGVTKKWAMLWWGLGLITFAGVLQITISVEYLYLLVRTNTVMLDSIGLILDIAGVVLLSLYGLPWVFVDGQKLQAPVSYQIEGGSFASGNRTNHCRFHAPDTGEHCVRPFFGTPIPPQNCFLTRAHSVSRTAVK